MSRQHPIIAVTGSSGAGTSTIRHAFKDVFRRLGIRRPILVHGDAFRRYSRDEEERVIAESLSQGKFVSGFGPDLNRFDLLEALFREYGETGGGKLRDYAHNAERAQKLGVPVGGFTEWKPIPEGTAVLLYEGQHGGVVANTWGRRRHSTPQLPPEQDRRKGERGVDVAQHVDFLIGVVPAVNLEWIQKIHRDCDRVGCETPDAVGTILRRMHDYVNFMVPQFTLTDINIQRMPLVDTSNPFIARDVPTADESILVIHFRHPPRYDFPGIMRRIPGARMTRMNTMIVPGGKLRHALEIVCGPIIEGMMEARA